MPSLCMQAAALQIRPKRGAEIANAKLQQILGRLTTSTELAVYIVITPDITRIFVKPDGSIRNAKQVLDEELDKWEINRVKFEASLPDLDQNTVQKIEYRGEAEYSWGHQIGQTGSETDSKEAATARHLTTIVDRLSAADLTAVYRASLMQDAEISTNRHKRASQLEENSPSITGKTRRLIFEDNGQWETAADYAEIEEMMTARGSTDYILNVDLVVGGDGAAKAARDVESAFKSVGSDYYWTTGEVDTVEYADIKTTPTADVTKSLPSTIPGYKRLRSNTSRSIVASPAGAIEYLLPSVQRLSDGSRDSLMVNHSASP